MPPILAIAAFIAITLSMIALASLADRVPDRPSVLEQLSKWKERN